MLNQRGHGNDLYCVYQSVIYIATSPDAKYNIYSLIILLQSRRDQVQLVFSIS